MNKRNWMNLLKPLIQSHLWYIWEESAAILRDYIWLCARVTILAVGPQYRYYKMPWERHTNNNRIHHKPWPISGLIYYASIKKADSRLFECFLLSASFVTLLRFILLVLPLLKVLVQVILVVRSWKIRCELFLIFLNHKNLSYLRSCHLPIFFENIII